MKSGHADSFFFYNFVKVTGVYPGFLFFRPKRLHMEGKTSLKGPCLVVANHNSMSDPIYIMCSIPSRSPVFVASSDLFRTRLGRWFFTHVHCIEVNKENFSMSTFHGVRDNLEKGRMVVIFPEGGLQDKQQVNPFKDGAAMMAMRCKVPIIPIYVKPRKHWYERITIAIGRRIEAQGQLNMETVRSISKELYEAEVRLKGFCEKS
ncbi:MAG: 1-acyl-sn-glycerol-3-phosphate acyltransferase [Spirochaetales bacterium]|nr:1-acyl-sn-glycerol-3-phosphate acyltransferase [Spirochaetales bacterium]